MSAFDTLSIRINRDGWRFIAGFAVASLVLGLIFAPLGWVGAVLTGWCAYFFRDPDRVTPSRPGLIVSPADGVLQRIERSHCGTARRASIIVLYSRDGQS